MILSHACHRHEKCSVNSCPLESNNYSAVEGDSELTCPLSDFDIEKIKERYNRIKNHPIVKPETEPLPNLNLRSEQMRDTNGQLFRANNAQREKINSLVKKECCNYNKSKGTCILLDTKCPQMITASIICSWCREAIIPLDKVLEQGIFEPEKNEKVTAKKCAVCGKAIQANSNRAKYCPKCALQVHKNKTVTARKKKQTNGCN